MSRKTREALPFSGTVTSRGKLSHCEVNTMFFASPGPGVANGTPLGSTSRPPFVAGHGAQAAVVDLRRGVHVPGPCADALRRIASEQNGERGDTYLPGRKISVTRSLNCGARLMRSHLVEAGSLAVQSVELAAVWFGKATAGNAAARAARRSRQIPTSASPAAALVNFDDRMAGDIFDPLPLRPAGR